VAGSTRWWSDEDARGARRAHARRIVELLAERERSAGEIASHFPTSRPGSSRYLRVLHDHSVVRTRKDAQGRLYSLDPARSRSWTSGFSATAASGATGSTRSTLRSTGDEESRPEGGTMQTVTPYLLYEDVDAALALLSKAFGFREELRNTREAGYVNHAQP
jgi:DNA-binding transcriptional ArsR family regulator